MCGVWPIIYVCVCMSTCVWRNNNSTNKLKNIFRSTDTNCPPEHRLLFHLDLPFHQPKCHWCHFRKERSSSWDHESDSLSSPLPLHLLRFSSNKHSHSLYEIHKNKHVAIEYQFNVSFFGCKLFKNKMKKLTKFF